MNWKTSFCAALSMLLISASLASAAAPRPGKISHPDTRAPGYWAKHGMTSPVLEQRPVRPYVGIRTRVNMRENWGARVIPDLYRELFTWLRKKGIKPAGAPFVRYLIIDMQGQLDIDLGVPVAVPVVSENRIHAGSLPAGRYALLEFTGPPGELEEANAALQDWAARKGIVWKTSPAKSGTRWAARVESSLTDPQTQPDQRKWKTEIAYLTRDAAPGTRRRAGSEAGEIASPQEKPGRG